MIGNAKPDDVEYRRMFVFQSYSTETRSKSKQYKGRQYKAGRTGFQRLPGHLFRSASNGLYKQSFRFDSSKELSIEINCFELLCCSLQTGKILMQIEKRVNFSNRSSSFLKTEFKSCTKYGAHFCERVVIRPLRIVLLKNDLRLAINCSIF